MTKALKNITAITLVALALISAACGSTQQAAAPTARPAAVTAPQAAATTAPIPAATTAPLVIATTAPTAVAKPVAVTAAGSSGTSGFCDVAKRASLATEPAEFGSIADDFEKAVIPAEVAPVMPVYIKAMRNAAAEKKNFLGQDEFTAFESVRSFCAR